MRHPPKEAEYDNLKKLFGDFIKQNERNKGGNGGKPIHEEAVKRRIASLIRNDLLHKCLHASNDRCTKRPSKYDAIHSYSFRGNRFVGFLLVRIACFMASLVAGIKAGGGGQSCRDALSCS